MSERTDDVGASALRAGGTARMTLSDRSNSAGQFLAFVECAGCGESFPVRSRLGLNRAKWCSERCRKAQYAGRCVDCGGPTNGSDGRGSHAAKRCATCNAAYTGSLATERSAGRREIVERLWAEGKTAREIAQVMGWKGKNYVDHWPARLRQLGYNLPHRRTPEQIARMTANSAADLTRARAAYSEQRKAAA